jgi:hypothetical protein
LRVQKFLFHLFWFNRADATTRTRMRDGIVVPANPAIPPPPAHLLSIVTWVPTGSARAFAPLARLARML